MGIFALRSRTAPAVDPGAGATIPEPVRMGLPPRFEAVAEMLASGSDSTSEACAVAGALLAKDGASLDEALAALQTTYQTILGTGTQLMQQLPGGEKRRLAVDAIVIRQLAGPTLAARQPERPGRIGETPSQTQSPPPPLATKGSCLTQVQAEIVERILHSDPKQGEPFAGRHPGQVRGPGPDPSQDVPGEAAKLGR